MFGKQEGSQTLAGLRRAVVLRVCAQQAQQLQAFKLARWAYTQLQALRLPSSWQVCNTGTGQMDSVNNSMVQSTVNHVTCDDVCMTGVAHTRISYCQLYVCMLRIFIAELPGCAMQDSVDLLSVQLHGSPFTDAEEVLPTCYRCGSSNPLVNAQVSLPAGTSHVLSRRTRV